jgi:lipid-A-disaccharide synthase
VLSPLVVLLPGSRASELKYHLPTLAGALDLMRAVIPELRARMVLPNAALVEQTKASGRFSHVEIQSGGLGEALVEASIALASTGTVTMECACFGVPTVTLYKMSWSNYEVGRRLIKIKTLTMPNLLANEPVFPEFIQAAATPENIGRAALELLRDDARRQAIRGKLKQIIGALGGPGANRRAARAIIEVL